MKLPRFEHLYCGFTFSLPFVAKFGRGIVAEQRWKNIKQDLSAELGYSVTVYVFRLPVLYAQQCENLICYFYGKWKFKGLKYSTGRTEFYWLPNFITFLLTTYLFWRFKILEPHWKAVVFLLLPIPIDGFFIVLAIALVQYAVIGGIFWALLTFLNFV